MAAITFVKETNNTVLYTIDGVEQSLLPQSALITYDPNDSDYVRLYSKHYNINERMLYSDVTAPVAATGKLLFDALRTTFFF